MERLIRVFKRANCVDGNKNSRPGVQKMLAIHGVEADYCLSSHF